jgi:hypothetical protein
MYIYPWLHVYLHLATCIFTLVFGHNAVDQHKFMRTIFSHFFVNAVCRSHSSCQYTMFGKNGNKLLQVILLIKLLNVLVNGVYYCTLLIWQIYHLRQTFS